MPALYKGVGLAACDEVVCHGRVVHPGDTDAVRGRGVLELGPADAVEGADEDDADVHEDAAEEVETGAAEEVCAVGAHVLAGHGALDECLWEHFRGDGLECVVGRVWDAVEHADCPRGPADAVPVDDVSLAPFRHCLDPGVPVGPDVLLRGHWAVVGERGEDCFVAAGVERFGGFELVLELFGDLVLGHVAVL